MPRGKRGRLARPALRLLVLFVGAAPIVGTASAASSVRYQAARVVDDAPPGQAALPAPPSGTGPVMVGEVLALPLRRVRQRPNVVLFLVDDLGWQDTSVPFLAERTPLNKRYRTPSLERLAARGVWFTNAYAAAPVCTPTRTSIMTGQSPGRTHITYWTLHKDTDTSKRHPLLAPPVWNMNGLQADDVTLPRLLQAAGYRTIHVGKAHFGAHDTSGADPRNLGFDVSIAGHGSGAPASYYGIHNFSGAGRKGKSDGKETVWDVPGLEQYHGQDIYLTEALAIEADKAVRAAVATGKPFFLNMAPYAVHAPIMANERYLDHYQDLDATEAAYATMIETVDAALGSLVQTLDELGVADNTVVIFSSDNGGLSAHARGKAPDGHTQHTHNAPLRSGKGSAYEGGTRVPTVIAWPGVSRGGSVCHTPIVSHDFFATILSVAGVGIPDEYAPQVDGRDLTPLVLGKPGFDAARSLCWNQPHQWGAPGPGIEPFTSIRTGDWKLVYFHAGRRFELYNLVEDIGEMSDMAEQRPEKVRELSEGLDAWIESSQAQLSADKRADKVIELPGAAFADQTGGERELLLRATACTPHPRQVAWQRLEFSAFAHFGVNTFTDREWGDGQEDPAIFSPTEFDADQWVQAFKAAGIKQLVLTAKHHDGFCLWPSAYTEHSVRSSPWRGGSGDVVGEVAAACRRYGLKLGVYLSPADLYQIEAEGGYYGNGSAAVETVVPTPVSGRPQPERTFTYVVDDYNRYFLNQLYELLTSYGPLHEVWFDGANPKPGTGQTYNYQAWYDLIRQLAPDAVIAIKGPDVRWVGNEAGHGRTSEWSVIPLGSPPETATWPDMTAADLGSRAMLRGAPHFHWHPAETDVSIRPGWFYRASEDDRVKSLDHLLEIYYASVGNNSLLLLNVPPDRRGLVHENDVARLHEFGQVLRETFAENLADGATAVASAQVAGHASALALDTDPDTFWTTPDWTEAAELEITLAGVRRFNRAALQEHLQSGQRIEAHALDAWIDGQWRELTRATTIGYKRLLRFDAVETDRVRVRILAARVRPTLSGFGLYYEPPRGGRE
ncbi:MAG: sulfatase-like hydrolase/transferase [Planctomycetes bacterium]|nr:sulfatase-like hydrolase/transferase [Planctomycetota bacterium]